MTEFPTEKIDALHAHLKLRGGKMTTTAIGVAVLGRDMSPHTENELQKLLEREADWLDIEPVSVPGDGLCWRRKEPLPAPTRNGMLRDWSLDGTIMQTALLVAREVGAEGVPPGRAGLPSTEVVNRLSDRLGEPITPNAFAPSSTQLGGKWRDEMEEAYQSGRQEYLAKAESVKDAKSAGEEPDAAPSILAPSGPLPEPEELSAEELAEAITELREIVSNGNGNGNGNGYHPAEPDEPTDDDLSILQEVEYLESELEEAKREIEALQRRDEEAKRLEQRLQEAQERIALLEALEAASKAVEVSTHQPNPSGTLESLLGTLEAQLVQARDEETEAEWRRREAAAKVADLSEKLTAARQLVQVLEG